MMQVLGPKAGAYVHASLHPVFQNRARSTAWEHPQRYYVLAYSFLISLRSSAAEIFGMESLAFIVSLS
jgi:hypothetical protein